VASPAWSGFSAAFAESAAFKCGLFVDVSLQ